MIEAMAEKADLRLLARKVSHDQFELACVDLSRGLDHALSKLSVQVNYEMEMLLCSKNMKEKKEKFLHFIFF